jgi:hypothetical protein
LVDDRRDDIGLNGREQGFLGFWIELGEHLGGALGLEVSEHLDPRWLVELAEELGDVGGVQEEEEGPELVFPARSGEQLELVDLVLAGTAGLQHAHALPGCFGPVKKTPRIAT